MNYVRRSPLFRLLLVPLMALALMGLAACDDESEGPEAGVDVEDITDDEAAFFDDPEAFVGEEVTVSADVSLIISDQAFRIAGEDIGGEGLLVFSAEGMTELTDASVVQVTGTVRTVVVDSFEEDFGFEFEDEDEDLGVFEGEPAIDASNVTVLEQTPDE